VLSDAVRQIGSEVRNTIDFHLTQDGSGSVEQLVLTGPAVAIPGFADLLGAEIGLPVELGQIPDPTVGTGDAERYAVAAGLTVEAVPA
jgi:Tfp pilus assembly PilM family ATPase